MEFARVNEYTLTVDQQRVMIISDCVSLTGRLGMSGAREQSGAKEEKADPGSLDRGRHRLERIVGVGCDSRSIRIGSGGRREHRCTPFADWTKTQVPQPSQPADFFW